MFAFGGIELIGMAAAEAEEPAATLETSEAVALAAAAVALEAAAVADVAEDVAEVLPRSVAKQKQNKKKALKKLKQSTPSPSRSLMVK